MRPDYTVVLTLLGPLAGLLGTGSWALTQWSHGGETAWLALAAAGVILGLWWQRRWRRRWAARVLGRIARSGERGRPP